MAEHSHLQDNAVVRTALSRPITMLMIFASVLVLGFIAFLNIPLELIPSGFSAPFLSVEVPYSNATAQDVEDKITRPLEDELATTPHIDELSATSSSNRARVNMLFEQDADMDIAYREVRDRIARVRPDDNFLCCEVHEPGVGALLKRIGEQGLTNIRILQHDAVEVIDHMLPPGSLDGVHIFFPDPWHKKKHNKRRLIQPPLVAKLAARLKPGGYLHCATDWQPYAEQMLQVLSAEPLLQNTAPGYAPQPDYRPLTKFENRGLRLGHGVWDLVFLRRH